MESILTPFYITIAVLAVSSVFFIRGRVRPDMVGLCAMLALMLLGILEPAEALAGFSSSVLIMMVGLFIVGAGIFRTGLARMISSRILRIGGNNENLLFILVMLVTAFTGAFVSNTGTVAVMMPIVMSMAASSGISPRRYLMPMAFASGMGLFTLISTPPNLVIQETLVGAGYEPLGFFAFTPVSTVIVLVGVVLLFFSSRLLVRKDEKADDSKNKAKSLEQLIEEYNLSKETSRVSVPAGSPIVGKSLSELNIAAIYEVSISKVIHTVKTAFRKTVTEETAGPNTKIMAGDVLFCHGAEENINRFIETNGLGINETKGGNAVVGSPDSGFAEVFIMPNSRLINHTVANSRFRELYNVNVVGIKRQGEYNIDIRDVKLHSGDALLIQGPWKEITALSTEQDDFVLVGQPDKDAENITLDRKAPVAAAIMIGMIVVMVLDVVPAVAAVLTAAVLMVISGCLRNMEEAYNSINWSSIILIGSMIPMATAFEKTGITAAITDFLLTGLGDIGPHALLAVIYFSTSLFTMFISNTATAILFAPIALQAAVGMGVSPYTFLFAVAVSASMCFASPFSTPPNALVMSAGGYTVGDFIKVGLPLQIIMGVVMVFVLPLLFPF